MCGICGFIGKSKKPDVSYELITKLFEKVESRGVDASGVWATQPGKEGEILYHKEPIKATEFVKKDVWKHIQHLNPDLILCHARAATYGVGVPEVNKNNHPFCSSDRNVGVIHNGKVDKKEFYELKKMFHMFSDCDSELFLRIFEQERPSIPGIFRSIRTASGRHRS